MLHELQSLDSQSAAGPKIIFKGLRYRYLSVVPAIKEAKFKEFNFRVVEGSNFEIAQLIEEHQTNKSVLG